MNKLFIFPFIAFHLAVSAQQCREDVAAFSPYNMKCQQFSTSCEIPQGWVEVEQCDITPLAEGLDPTNDVAEVLKSTRRFRDKPPMVTPQAQAGQINPMAFPMPKIPDALKPSQGASAQPPSPGGMRFYMGN